MRHAGWTVALLVSSLVVGNAVAQTDLRPADEDSQRRWSVHLDDDLFSFADRDRDYTGGVTFGLTGMRAHEHPLSLAGALEHADRAARFAVWRGDSTLEGEAFEIGLLLFTPQNLAASQPLHDDRPYANLLYAASSEVSLDETRGAAFQSTLSVGVMGLAAAEAVQRAVHSVGGSTQPRGYSHQISDGGEPTLEYRVAADTLLVRKSSEPDCDWLQASAGGEAGVGYNTYIGAGGLIKLGWMDKDYGAPGSIIEPLAGLTAGANGGGRPC
jgi:hypothetical protein